ncbi:Methyltransferase domain-containing protein [Thiohalospira halophila DSM 15071]|uniref:Methyltransferase domain-containing protein n=1 Tax=Thiohalospira halophila DSM 15071 TaxID=1123397 RepID=A0A1I1NH75_9GAMM|nr:class I SAM-dependent methyltransferase [Thiohalospira halophila]SFC96622.1 Methyltransferase domain-containing protein [Thiohalospira halophila DSM 15071]
MNSGETLFEVAACLGQVVERSSKILDFGCGNGSRVKALRTRGYDALGVDIKFKDGPHTNELQKQGYIKCIEEDPYRLPFPDAYFDFVFSEQVFEHLKNPDEVVAELARVMKPGGLGLHRFPARLRPLESHVQVPLSSVFRPSWWMLFWTWAGFRKSSQKFQPVHEVALKNRGYLDGNTNYLSGREISSLFVRRFSAFGYAGKCWLNSSPNKRGRSLGRVSNKLPFLAWVYQTFWTRVVYHFK